jgi:hypothetical protein
MGGEIQWSRVQLGGAKKRPAAIVSDAAEGLKDRD